MDYAAGSLDPGFCLLIATYMTLSPRARAVVAECEVLGGVMLDQMCEPVSVSEECLARVLNSIDCGTEDCCVRAASLDIQRSASSIVQTVNSLPAPLAGLFAPSDARPKWRHAPGGFSWIDLPVAGARTQVQLLRAAPGTAIPHHGHSGLEVSLILDGAMEDEAGRYSRGHLAIQDRTTTHKPSADRESGCLCLIVSEGPMRFTGTLTRLLNPFL